MEKYYEIGGLVLKVISPFRFGMSGEDEFRCEPKNEDFIFEFVRVSDIPSILGRAEYVANARWADVFRQHDGCYLRAFLWKQFYLSVTEIKENHGYCYYVSEEYLEKRSSDGFEPFTYLCIEEIMRNFDGLILHSSHVMVPEGGFVFSAPSQTGKSTQAELWRQYAGAKILNGDRSILRKIDGKWYVYGCPMSGTSGIHYQGHEELKHIVMLEKGPENQLTRINGRFAFMELFPQITTPMWDERETEHVMDLIEDLMNSVPVWYYSCTKEPEAVQVLKDALFPSSSVNGGETDEDE